MDGHVVAGPLVQNIPTASHGIRGLRDRWGRRWPDLAIAFAFALIAAFGSYAGTLRLTKVVRAPAMSDVWFDGDIPRVSVTLTDRWSDKHQRARVHPLFPLLTVPAYGLRALGVSQSGIVTAFTVLVAFLWPTVLFALLRAMGLARTDAAVFTALGLTSGAAVFWLTVPESYTLASETVMLGLLPAALAGRKHVRDRWFVVASACSLSVTTTNWTAGLLATAVRRNWLRTIGISLIALILVIVLARLQRIFVPLAGFFLGGVGSEKQFLFNPTAARIGVVLHAIFVHAMVVPGLTTIARQPVCVIASQHVRGHWTALSAQRSAGAVTSAGVVATVGWIVVFAAGIWSGFRRWRTDRFVWAVALFLLGQIALHLVYGKETFLYALDYMPALISIAAFGALGRHRRVVLVCAAGVAVLAGVNNVQQFAAASDFVAAEAVRSASTCTPVGESGRHSSRLITRAFAASSSAVATGVRSRSRSRATL